MNTYIVTVTKTVMADIPVNADDEIGAINAALKAADSLHDEALKGYGWLKPGNWELFDIPVGVAE